ncbi:pyridoxal phosphatase [Limnobaculum zhutongyuii]|uniref:Pyridoxal phosphatase n=1 Tax=Limnobaculum zhutongyuii TaxID=2498113 RepID=A0A411WKR9_9GAMM|nr:pyridoxal phosphatase [Limnobaculum zhutongyuii]QBH96748.1 pyridoxal phosphatase [Limnobaculum zhutongyuii]TQS90221.1 pyridoxal phosphatase [Limnobaculum zhutongyuii]
MKYQIIALDLDGTLLNSQKQILQESLDTLALARQQGVKVVIVTGRHHVAIHPFYQALQLDTPAICCNGTYTYHYQKQQVLSGTPLTKSQATRVAQLLRNHPIQSLMYIDNAMTFEQKDDSIDRWYAWAARLPENQRPNMLHVDKFETAIDQANNVWKFATSSDDEDALNHFSKLVEKELGLACERSWHNQIDLAQQGNSKGNRLREWVESQGISMNNVIAFGDNLNDVSMLSQAGLGVAMGNSSDEVKMHANLVAGENDTPTIANIIRERVLQQ